MSAADVVDTFWKTFCSRDIEGCLKYVADDVQVYRNGHGPLNRDQFRELGKSFLAGFGTIEFTNRRVVEDGENVASKYDVVLTHTGTFQGIPETGKTVINRVAMFDRVVDGKIVERLEVADDLGLLTQLGAIPAPSSV